MDQIDEFESIFRRAQRQPFHYEAVTLTKVLLVTDASTEQAEKTLRSLCAFLPQVCESASISTVAGDRYRTVTDLLEIVEQEQPELIVTYRYLREESLIPQHSLGVYLDVLTQATSVPVLVLPTALVCNDFGDVVAEELVRLTPCEEVMVVTDHISGDDRLINHAVGICPKSGTLWLCHVEDDAVFERYMQAIERIPEIVTDEARRLIGDQLLKEANDFMTTCQTELKQHVPELSVDRIVMRGHRLRQYHALVEDRRTDLLVANTKDQGQLAMHGMAYSLAVELMETPLLLL